MRRITNLRCLIEGLHPGWWSRHIKKNMYKFSMNSTHARLKMCICAQGGIIWGLRKGKACINALMQNFQHVWLLFSYEKSPLSLPSLQNDILNPSLRLCCNAEFSAWCIFYSHPPPPLLLFAPLLSEISNLPHFPEALLITTIWPFPSPIMWGRTALVREIVLSTFVFKTEISTNSCIIH